MSRFQTQGSGPLRRETGNRPNTGGASFAVLFDPDKPEQELYDTLAEQQAQSLENINSSQLRKYFGETKDLYRQFNALTAAVHDNAEKQRIYHEQVEARFKMLRSKVAYALGRPSLHLDRNFATFLQEGIKKVQNHQHFVRFVMHFEAVVGFMYGQGKVKS